MYPKPTIQRLCERCQKPFMTYQKDIRRGKGRFCSKSCAVRFRHGSPEQRFVSCVNKTNTCWLWTARVNGSGYGVMHAQSGEMLAHRFSYELHVAPIPEGMQVLHRCDVPACVNPDHLFLGTHADNMRDMAAKGRGTAGSRSKIAKLTEDQVRDIRRRFANGGVMKKELADQYGVAPSRVSEIIARKAWRHVE